MSEPRLTVILPAPRCPFCGAVEKDGDGQAWLKPTSSRVIGDTRERRMTCRQCGHSWRLLLVLAWKPDTEAAKARIVREG